MGNRKTPNAPPGNKGGATVVPRPGSLATHPPRAIGIIGAPRKDVSVVTVPADVSGRLLLAAYRGLPYLPEDVRKSVAALLTPQAMAVIGGVAAIWTGSQFFGVGELFDVVMGGVTIATVGWDGIKALRGFCGFYNQASNATTEKDIDEAAHTFASAILSAASAIGFAALGKWLGRGTAGVVVAETDAAKLARWTKFIESMKFDVPPNEGMLFSKLISEEEAIKRAEENGLTCILQASDKYSFRALYNKEFGDQKTSLTKSIWEMLSVRFAGSLEGKVTAFVNRGKLYDTLNENAALRAARDGAPDTAETLHEIKKLPYERAAPETFDSKINDPVFQLEDETIANLLVKNPKITELQVLDTESKEVFGVRTPELQRWFQSRPHR